MNRKQARPVNAKLGKICYVDTILEPVEEVLNSFGYYLANEDGTPLECILCGEDSQDLFDIAKDGVLQGKIAISWHKMQSGRWEVVACV